MMKTIRKIAKLFVPSGLMHLRLAKKHGLKIALPGDSAVAHFAVACSPYAVSAILQQRKPTDKRCIKYFLPYGKMREHVKSVYGMNVGCKSRDRGLLGWVRAVMPYGLVLWWDAEDERLARKATVPKAVVCRPEAKQVFKPAAAHTAVTVAEYKSLKAQVESLRRTNEFRAVSIEIVALRTALGGVHPSVTLVLTGCYEAGDVRRSLDAHLRNSICEMEVFVVCPARNEDVAVAVSEYEIDPRIKMLDSTGKSLPEVRSEALVKATGDYIAFLNVNDRYADWQTLEILVLTSAVERAKICGGKQLKRVNGKAVYPDLLEWERRGFVSAPRPPMPAGLAAVIYDRKWLAATGLRPLSSSVGDDVLFLRSAEVLAGRIFSLGRTVSVLGRDAVGDQHTLTEKNIDVLRCVVDLARFCQHRNLAAVRAFLVEEVLKNQVQALRSLAWGADAKCARPLFNELSNLLPECDVEKNFLKPLVSVVVPAYNVAAYLPRCLDSLAGQKLMSMEVIVVDDGSPDAVGDIADKYVQLYPNFKVVHQQNSGLSAARNAGMDIACGKYIGFVDGDDWVDADTYRQMSLLLEKNEKCELGLFAAKVEYEYPVGAAEIVGANEYYKSPAVGCFPLTAALARRINGSACTKLYRFDFLRENGFRFPLGMNNEDEVFWTYVTARATNVVITDARYYHYIRNASGITAVQTTANNDDGSLPDHLTKCAPLMLSYLRQEDRLDLLGNFFYRLCGVSNRFKTERVFKCISRILHEAEFPRFVEFLNDSDIGYVRRHLSELANYAWYDEPYLPADSGLLPAPRRCTPKTLKAPIVSFVIPVYNALPYIDRCMESLRKQTVSNIELIFVDNGSLDGSGAVIEEYSLIDSRVRLLSMPNHGPGPARNKGITAATGKYVAFVDADDWIDARTVELITRLMDIRDLDVCAFDFEMFDTNTRRPLNAYWSLSKHLSAFPANRVFSFSELGEWPVYTSAWSMFYRRDFLVAHGFQFREMVFGEDAAFVYSLLPHVRRASVLPQKLYHYRRNNSRSLVGVAAIGGAGAEEARKMYYRELDALSLNYPQSGCLQYVKRMFCDVIYNVKLHPEDCRYILDECKALHAVLTNSALVGSKHVEEYRLIQDSSCNGEGRALSDVEDVLVGATLEDRCLIKEIEDERCHSEKDLYIVMGQLNSRTNEPIDSWTFFEWLQKNGVPSKYVLWKQHFLYGQLCAQGRLKDIIALEGDGVSDCEFLRRCKNELVRAKVVIQENAALNKALRRWLYRLPECDYVFMQHGVFCTSMTPQAARLVQSFNHVNVSSTRERDFIMSKMAGDPQENRSLFLMAGLPRWDLLECTGKTHKKSGDRPIVFIMFTWRSSFDKGEGWLLRSAYYHGLQNLLSKENMARLSDLGYQVVVAPHHHLANSAKKLDFGEDVEVVDTTAISKWIRKASICVTDFSSVSIDFVFQCKPTIYWIPDRDDLFLDPTAPDDGGKVASAAVNLRDMYNVVKTPAEVIGLLEMYKERNFKLEPEKVKIANANFAYRRDICWHLYSEIESRREGRVLSNPSQSC